MENFDVGKQMPHNIEAEQALLGAVLLDPVIILDVRNVLDIDDFYRREHQLIYQAMITLSDNNKEITGILLGQELIRMNAINDIGGVTYLQTLTQITPSSYNWEQYAEIVYAMSLKRTVIQKASELVESGYSTDVDVDDLLSVAETSMMNIGEDRGREGFKSMRDVVVNIFEELDEYSKKDNSGITGIPTGYRELDRMTSGLQRNDLIIVAARPSMGKTAFALNIAENVGMARDGEYSVAIFSLEMGAEQLATRMIASVGHIDSSSLRNRSLSNDEWDNLAMVTNRLAGTRIFIDDSPGIRVNDIRSKCLKLQAQHGLDLVIIDYLQLIQGSGGKRSENRQQEVSEISRMLKALARELESPVIALSQLSRGVEQRQDKRPMMSDLRESGSIEQDADIIAFLYRDDYYNRGDGDENDGGTQSVQDEIEIILAKHRNGPTGTVSLMFNKAHSKFMDIDFREYGDGYIPPN
ncbi:replicative DNA helicase [Phocicoccus pinnipedialis]|uniref:Replicative DNA helicase n=1 Tax=Phocicoccus pinnipedialis TaxID=110845 RepID=A0A6V7R5R2_9BACL|nr:replicative DNA helicase [Jeotgalicoccus pinnipedialis]MBP1939736.1 replicative DNA helicase [Jeotgalicoccus pinnipedialis]CAD2072358.1 Replicative DNA helicase [Jeotgalicoccus pinnipedialis]